MEASRAKRWAIEGARLGCIAAAGLAGLAVVVGPRSIVLPVAGVAALPTFLPFLHWRVTYFAPLNEWVAVLPCIVANWALIGGVAGWLADRRRGSVPALHDDRVAALERVVNDLGSDVARLQAHQDFDSQLSQSSERTASSSAQSSQ